MNMEALTKLIINIASKKRKVLALITVVTLLVYFPIFQNSFITSYDDGDFFIQWEELKDISNLPLLLGGNLPLKHNHVYRPFRSVMQTFVYQISSTHTFTYHLFALVVLIASAYLVYLITTKLLDQQTGLLAALFSAVLPTHTESITFITASFDTAGIVFMLLSFYLYILYREKNTRALLLWSIVSALIGYFTYDFALVLPILIALYEIVLRNLPKKEWLGLGKRLIPYLTGAALYLFIKYAIVGQRYFGVFFQHIPLHQRLMTMAKSFFLYIYYVVVNYPLSIYHKVTIASTLANAYVFAALIGTVVYIAFAWILYKKNLRIYAFLMLWFLVSMLPVANIVEIASYLSEHYLYLASVSWVILIALVFTKAFASVKTSKELRAIAFTLCAILFFSYAGIAFARNREWRNDETFWHATIKRDPDFAEAYINLAFYYAQEKKENEKAMSLLKQALKIDPDNALAFGNVGLILMEQGQFEKAIMAFNKALETETNNAAFFLNRGFSYHSLGKTEEALQDYREAIRIYPNFYRANFNLAVLYMELKRYDDAIMQFERSLKINSKDHESYYGLAEAYHQKGDWVKAFEYVNKSLQLNPSFAPAIELQINL